MTFGETKGLKSRLDADGADERAWKEILMCGMMAIGHGMNVQDQLMEKWSHYANSS